VQQAASSSEGKNSMVYNRGKKPPAIRQMSSKNRLRFFLGSGVVFGLRRCFVAALVEGAVLALAAMAINDAEGGAEAGGCMR